MGRGLIIIERNKFGFVYVFSDRRAIKKMVISSTNMNRMAILLNSKDDKQIFIVIQAAHLLYSTHN